MKWNPVLNATVAVAYISLIVLFMQFIQSVRHDTPDRLIDGVSMLSLFVFSVAVMAYLFFYQPVVLLLEHKKSEAVAYFVKTLGVFGIVVIILLTLVSIL